MVPNSWSFVMVTIENKYNKGLETVKSDQIAVKGCQIEILYMKKYNDLS